MQPRLRRVLFNVLCKDMARSVSFYQQLANFSVVVAKPQQFLALNSTAWRQ